MEFEKYTDFEKFALIPVGQHLRRKYDDSYADYINDLSRKHRGTLQEIRDNKRKYSEDRDTLLQYFSDLFIKVTELKESLFRDTRTVPDFIYLLEDAEPDGIDNAHSRSIMALKRMVYSIYILVEADHALVARPVETANIGIPIRNKPRIPQRGSFMLLNPNVNFNAIHARLTSADHQFIEAETTTVDKLRSVFTGTNITDKVVWYDANSLRYLIRELVERNIVEPLNEGKWKRTINCFKPEQGEFQTKNFKNTKDPVATVTLLLDETIRLFLA